ncbi:MAG TPA: glycosyl hydrolase family 18 protein [Candidatus Paceibacterota bacterium]|nr:glycosyl hydrolase family 18 protein [Candidatus Paceibacterota bacterium]
MKRAFTALLAALLLAPGSAFAAPEASFEVSGWMPYWTVAKGVRSARAHMESLDAVQPFVYAVQPDGSIKDLGGMTKSTWKRLLREAKKEGVRVTPTVMWSDGASIHTVLSDPTLRKKHIEAIVDIVEDRGYDGIDIDYEGKRAETRPYYSLFLKELDAALGSKFLACTTEARTPLDSLYTVVPAKIEYANDYVEINKYCDRVYLMTYDQQRADIKLNKARLGLPYYPVADPEWIRKVVNLAAQTIDKDKIVLGIATYGREVQVTASPQSFSGYNQLWSVNGDYPEDTADDADVKPSRNAAGELSFTYIPEDSSVSIPRSVKAPAGTPSGMETAARALAYANQTGRSVTFNLVWWSDAESVRQKTALAKELGLRGVSIFKIDGAEDKDIWKLF